jgi:sugar phosphate isomerase/epimerase
VSAAAHTFSFMGANYVARELGYDGIDDWGRCDAATNAAFAPIETYEERLDAVLAPVRDAGFDRIDLWTAHLNWRWATSEHLELAAEALGRHGLEVVSMAGGFGDTTDDLAAACRVATAVGAPFLGGMGRALTDDPRAAAHVLREHGVRLGLENHPERNPDEVLAKLGHEGDVVGVTVDTGWFATHGYDAAAAIRELDERVFHVHLKDVERPGEHVTCTHGTGCVDIDACVDALQAIGYGGPVSIEHEPFDHDPTAECVDMHAALRGHLEHLHGGTHG